MQKYGRIPIDFDLKKKYETHNQLWRVSTKLSDIRGILTKEEWDDFRLLCEFKNIKMGWVLLQGVKMFLESHEELLRKLREAKEIDG